MFFYYYSRRDCTEDYIQFYVGATLSSSNLIRYYGISKGRFCNRRESMFFSFDYDRIVTVYYRTNGRNIRSDVTGFKMSYNLRGKLSCLLLCPHSFQVVPSSKILYY